MARYYNRRSDKSFHIFVLFSLIVYTLYNIEVIIKVLLCILFFGIVFFLIRGLFSKAFNKSSRWQGRYKRFKSYITTFTTPAQHVPQYFYKGDINRIDNMDGIEFEQYLKILFSKLGYKAIRTPNSNDFGADLILTKDGIKTAVQAKRYIKSVGIRAVQEVISAKSYYKCSEAIVITNSYFTLSAEKLAYANHVKLFNRDKLIELMDRANQSDVYSCLVSHQSRFQAIFRPRNLD